MPEEAKSCPGEFESEVTKKTHKGGGRMKWLSKLIPGRRSSAVVAPAPENDLQTEPTEAERATGCTLAWQNPAGSRAGIQDAGGTEDQVALRHAAAADHRSSAVSAEPADAVDAGQAAAADTRLPVLSAEPANTIGQDAEDNRVSTMSAESAPKSAEPLPSHAALAQSLKLAAALASVSAGGTDSTSEGTSAIGDYSRDGNAPLPLELLDGATVSSIEGLDIGGLLPPLPKVDAHKLNAKEDIPGSANESSAFPGAMSDLPKSEGSCHSVNSTQPAEPRPRPASFRGLSKKSNPEADVAMGSFTQQKGSATPQKGTRGGSSEMSSLFSRPTTAGDSAILSFPTSRQSTNSLAWNEQWTPGGVAPAQTLGQRQHPLPPPLPAPDEIPRSVTSSSSKTLALPQEQSTTPSAGQDPFELALRQASKRTSIQWATAPSANRSRWSKATKKGVEELTDPGLPATPAGYPSASSRPVSRELQQLAVAERADFSELAVSFAFLDEDM